MRMNLTRPLIMNSSQGKIKTFAELNRAKQKLTLEVKEQESNFLSSPIFTIPAAILDAGSFKSGLKSSMESISLHDYKKVALNLISTALLANRKTRKFAIGFIIAKEMVPFILEKVNEFVKK
jgi:hypothetical protein